MELFALVSMLQFLQRVQFLNMYEPDQREEIEVGPVKKRKKGNTFKILKMQMHRLLLNAGVCITSLDTVYESCSVPLVYRLQNTPSSGIFYFKRHT